MRVTLPSATTSTPERCAAIRRADRRVVWALASSRRRAERDARRAAIASRHLAPSVHIRTSVARRYTARPAPARDSGCCGLARSSVRISVDDSGISGRFNVLTRSRNPCRNRRDDARERVGAHARARRDDEPLQRLQHFVESHPRRIHERVGADDEGEVRRRILRAAAAAQDRRYSPSHRRRRSVSSSAKAALLAMAPRIIAQRCAASACGFSR